MKRLLIGVVIAFLMLAIAGCAPQILVSFDPDTITVEEDDGIDVYQSYLRFQFSGFGMLELGQFVTTVTVEGEVTGDILDMLIDEDFEEVDTNVWRYAENINEEIPVFPFMGELIGEEMEEAIEFDTTNWDDDDWDAARLLEEVEFKIELTGAGNEPISSATLTIIFQ